MLASKICLNCGKEFPGWVIIEGKKKNLQRRRYCLECSPFGSGLTRRLPGDSRPYKIRNRVKEVVIGQEIRCLECSRVYIYDKKKGHQSSICNSCNANHKRLIVKAKCLEYKGGQCERCGYSRCSRALTFHHRNREEKEFTISRWMTKSWENMKVELDKCDLLCSNCHMEIEDEIVKKNKESIIVPVA